MRAWRTAGRRWGIATGLVATTVACGILAPSAGAKVVLDKVTGHKFGILPPPPAAPAGNRAANPLAGVGAAATPCFTSDSTCASPLTYHGGAVQHGEKLYLLFWDPNGFAGNSSYVTDMQTWVQNLAAGDYSPDNTSSHVGNPLSVVQQYYDLSGPGGTKNFIPYAVQYGGAIMDTDPYPASGCTDSYTPFGSSTTVTLGSCLDTGQLYTELHSYVTAHSLPTGGSVEYFVLTPPNVGSCDDSTSQKCAISGYCAWHTSFGAGSTQLLFADQPWLEGTNCDGNHALGLPSLYSSGIDPVVGTFSHELAETMTDPGLSGWYGPGSGADEIGDKCAYLYSDGQADDIFTGLPTTAGSAYYNTTLNGYNYLLQMEFDNQANGGAGGCSQWDTDTQPTATLTAPAHVTPGVPASFSLTNVSDPAGIAYVNWSFGDSGTGRSTGTAAIQHAFAAAGIYTVTAIVTDDLGNEVKKTAPVTVTKASGASLSIKLTNTHPAPKALYTIKLTGLALPGGTRGTGHNRTEVDLFEQAGSCASTLKVESSRASAKTATHIGQWFAPAGSFAFAQQRTAVASQHLTVRFCGYVSASPL